MVYFGVLIPPHKVFSKPRVYMTPLFLCRSPIRIETPPYGQKPLAYVLFSCFASEDYNAQPMVSCKILWRLPILVIRGSQESKPPGQKPTNLPVPGVSFRVTSENSRSLKVTICLFSRVMKKQRKLAGGFKHFIFFIPTWGNDPVLLIFFKWVVQPPTSKKVTIAELPGSWNTIIILPKDPYPSRSSRFDGLNIPSPQ